MPTNPIHCGTVTHLFTRTDDVPRLGPYGGCQRSRSVPVTSASPLEHSFLSLTYSNTLLHCPQIDLSTYTYTHTHTYRSTPNALERCDGCIILHRDMILQRSESVPMMQAPP
ncbi:hypothetical protein BV25DRAFT_1181232 [Artomyces pyxidatus]|uniref:Uncharacterized protein n=1 Tax=Artomyces pyxidatus TaxID=48021 RepID=A0ACB8SQP9_9AGAM|nr:hypothetical protein BV25DRAFT_1181232 [Artomyces pyxidatus]